MFEPIIIHNGTHTGEPLGFLPKRDGSRIAVWSLDPLDLAGVMLQAIGTEPNHPVLGPGGATEPVKDRYGVTTQLVYNPAGDNLNSAAVEIYKADLNAFNLHAMRVMKAVEMIQKK